MEPRRNDCRQRGFVGGRSVSALTVPFRMAKNRYRWGGYGIGPIAGLLPVQSVDVEGPFVYTRIVEVDPLAASPGVFDPVADLKRHRLRR